MNEVPKINLNLLTQHEKRILSIFHKVSFVPASGIFRKEHLSPGNTTSSDRIDERTVASFIELGLITEFTDNNTKTTTYALSESAHDLVNKIFSSAIGFYSQDDNPTDDFHQAITTNQSYSNLTGGQVFGDSVLGTSGPPGPGPSMMNPSLDPPRNVRASNRYVSVRDNQEPFDQLEKSLDEIKDEFARDHNRGQYAIGNAELYLLNIDIVKAQIKRGLVNLDELRDQLRPSLQKLEADCKSLAIIGGTMLAAIAAAVKAIDFIIGG